MAEQLREERKEKNTDNILDLACGCGTSTRALASKFSDAELIVGVDTSPEMVSMGRFLQTFEIVLAEVQKKTKDEFKSKRYFSYDFILQLMKIIQRSRSINGTLQYARGNVERLKLPKASFDLVTIM
jgi:ubiquinone/menaquinone biosynthesis C-methylase UbiE